ncbi:helix-turn-helix domain-containing protein [Methylobacterium organophilum]|uniref:helix-turn-helix transcriptional regulator n=1 Tax=Methylobacterium organophilum TaxID=410 RepID=UPI0019CF7D53|nr:helix-turn-helix domain-containing protein [Methylobacterium organophilum]MBN6824122.1 helix-turn-helix domain-containing protein [Methylobacterium organophilum]
MADRYSVSVNTVANWVNNPSVGYPQPFKVNGRNYWRRAEIEAWEASQAGQISGEATAA